MSDERKRERAPVAQIGEYILPHTIGQHLPTPGKAPGWPMANIGQWRVDVAGSVAAWRRDLEVWRAEHLIRMGYSGEAYDRPELRWSQRNFVHTQMMVEDRYFYDPVAGRYTVDRYLDDLEARYGGVDSVLIWYVYTNIGIDDRNQTDLASDLPGGLAGLKQAVADFHRRGVKVFLPTMAWDNGTRPTGKTDWDAVIELAALVGADGVNGDTYNGVPRAFWVAAEAAGRPLVFQPESVPYADEALMWNLQSWGRATTEVVPAVAKLKWLEPRHLINIENRWARDRTDDFHYMFFNGMGYVAWENVWGVWNQLTPRDGETLRRLATISRHFAEVLHTPRWRPYADALQQGVFASEFPTDAVTLWTVVNRNEYDLGGEQLAVAHVAGRRYLDVWRGVELTPRLEGAVAHLAFELDARGFGCVAAEDRPGAIEGLPALLDRMASYARVPLHTLSNEWRAAPQQIVETAATAARADAPPGMVTIPAGDFDFVVSGIEIEGYTWNGLDVQYPWERSPRRAHRHRIAMRRFHIDRTPVTNAEFARFLADSGYRPADGHNFLRDWQGGAPRRGWDDKPVTWVSLEDARAYAAWAGKRLPREWEWQYSAQSGDGRLYPWGDRWDVSAMPPKNTGRTNQPPADVDAHPGGQSPFGVLDLVGNVWQWTDEYRDEHTRAAIVRGGSSYQPQTSHWYFPQAYQLDQHGKLLLMCPGKDRSAYLGFRCVVDG